MELFVALRYLRGKRRSGFISIITWISTLGVFLGTFALVLVLSIANGFEKEVRDRVVGTLAHAKIMLYHGEPIVAYDSLRQVILAQPGVTGAAPYINGKGMIESQQMQEGVMIVGIDPLLEPTVTDLKKTVKFGSFILDSAESEKERNFPGMIIGMGLADKIGIRPGAEAVLATLAPGEPGEDPSPIYKRFTVTGVFETGMYEYDLNLVYISIPAAQDIMQMRGVEGIQIRTTELFTADKTAEKVKAALGGYPYRSMDWKSQNRSLFKWMGLEKLIIFIVISFIILIAAFNIVSSLLMMILEKRREIGILMGMGTSERSIMKIFMFNGATVGFLGSTAGVILGVAICLIQYHWRIIPLPGDIYIIDKLPVLIQPFDIVCVYLIANVLCLVATLYPAYLASKVLPAESMRYE